MHSSVFGAIARTCPAKLYYKKLRYPTTLDEDPYMQSLADGGFMVGKLAQLQYPEGVLVSTLDPWAAIEETKRLLAEPAGLSRQARQALGYAQMINFIEGRTSLTKAVEQIKVATRQFAKHQRTWFRRFPGVHWLGMEESTKPTEVGDRIIREGWMAR